MGKLDSCDLCGGTLVLRFRDVVDPQSHESFELWACPCCGHARTWPIPADLERYYGQQYYGGRHGWTADYCVRRRMRLATRSCGAGAGRRLLDIGCGDGTFLLKARQHGWQVFGTELNPELARKEGLNVHPSLNEAGADGPFDCITAWHVLEHFVDPSAALLTVRRMLAPGGTLLLAVPDARGAQARLTGRKWLHLDVPRHLHHFGKRSLERHLAKAGFEIERVWYGEFEYDLLGWSQSVLNWLLREPNAFFGILTGHEQTMNRGKRAAHVVLGTLFSGLALLPTWLGMLTGGAGTLAVAARPRPESVGKDVSMGHEIG